MGDFLDNLMSDMSSYQAKTVIKKSSIELEAEKQQRRQQAAAKQEMERFRRKTRSELTGFRDDADKQEHVFPVLSQALRYIVHEVADELGLCSVSYGDEGIDRFAVVFKEGHEPSMAGKYAEKASTDDDGSAEAAEAEASATDPQQATAPRNDYRNKKLFKTLAQAAAVDQVHTLNKKKRDLRSIEEIQSEILQAKKAKLSPGTTREANHGVADADDEDGDDGDGDASAS